MPRTARAIEAGLIYHVLNRGNARMDVFQTAGSRRPGARASEHRLLSRRRISPNEKPNHTKAAPTGAGPGRQSASARAQQKGAALSSRGHTRAAWVCTGEERAPRMPARGARRFPARLPARPRTAMIVYCRYCPFPKIPRVESPKARRERRADSGVRRARKSRKPKAES